MLNNKLSTEENMVDVIALIKQEGREEGIERGRQEGERQKAIATARNLLKMELSHEQISAATELSLEDIAKIEQESKS